MTFVISRGFAKLQVLWKSENGPISWTEWNAVEPQNTEHLWFRAFRSVFWNVRFGTEWNIVMKFCIHIGIDKI